MLLAMSFIVLVEPVQKPAELVTIGKPFFQPEGGTSKTSTGAVAQPAEVFTGASPVQVTGDVAISMTATHPVEAPGTMMGSAASLTATQPVEAPGMRRLATQPVEAPGARTATQPVEAPTARSEVHSQPTSTGSVYVSAVDWSLTSKRSVTATNTGVSDSEDDLNIEPESLAAVSNQGDLSHRDPPKDDELDQEFSEEANYREMMRGECSFMGWHQIPDFDS